MPHRDLRFLPVGPMDGMITVSAISLLHIFYIFGYLLNTNDFAVPILLILPILASRGATIFQQPIMALNILDVRL